jgi:IMP dehydrogenase
MAILNGDAMKNPSSTVEDFSTALEVLKKDYPERDGIEVKTLIDSRLNGGLTYNDFLVLPGYIGTSPPRMVD